MPLTDSLISYWKLDEASGDRADIHGGNTMTDHNTVGSATGIIDTGALFTATDTDYLSHVDNAALSLGTDTDFTWSCWIKPASLHDSANGIIWKNNDFLGATTADYGIYLDVQGRLNFIVGNNSSNGQAQSPSSSISAGSWFFCVCWHDSTLDKLCVQLNNGTPSEGAWSGGTYDGAADLVFSNQFGQAAMSYDGILDEVGFWKRVLTADERTQLYNDGAGLAYSRFGGGSPWNVYAQQ